MKHSINATPLFVFVLGILAVLILLTWWLGLVPVLSIVAFCYGVAKLWPKDKKLEGDEP